MGGLCDVGAAFLRIVGLTKCRDLSGCHLWGIMGQNPRVGRIDIQRSTIV